MGKLLPVPSGLEPILQKLIGVMTYTNEWLKISSVTQTGAFQWCNLCQEKLVKLMLFVKLS